jgi:hypothetical protein
VSLDKRMPHKSRALLLLCPALIFARTDRAAPDASLGKGGQIHRTNAQAHGQWYAGVLCQAGGPMLRDELEARLQCLDTLGIIGPPAEGCARSLHAGTGFRESLHQVSAMGIERDLPAGEMVGQTVEERLHERRRQVPCGPLSDSQRWATPRHRTSQPTSPSDAPIRWYPARSGYGWRRNAMTSGESRANHRTRAGGSTRKTRLSMPHPRCSTVASRMASVIPFLHNDAA